MILCAHLLIYLLLRRLLGDPEVYSCDQLQYQLVLILFS